MQIFLRLMCESQLHVVLPEVPLYRTLKRVSANPRAEEEEEAASQGDYTPKLHHSPLKALEAFIINTLNIAEYTQITVQLCVHFFIVPFFFFAHEVHVPCIFVWTYLRHVGKTVNANLFFLWKGKL